jgi:hypothetical protein
LKAFYTNWGKIEGFSFLNNEEIQNGIFRLARNVKVLEPFLNGEGTKVVCEIHETYCKLQSSFSKTINFPPVFT